MHYNFKPYSKFGRASPFNVEGHKFFMFFKLKSYPFYIFYGNCRIFSGKEEFYRTVTGKKLFL